jgi:two-component system OmpR family sensor kinase
MHRAFLSLYSLIVIAVIGVGWGLDQLWNSYVPDVSVTAEQTHVMDLAERLLSQSSPAQRNQAAERLADEIQLELAIHSLEDFANSRLLDALNAGELAVVDSGDARIFYRTMDAGQVISWRQSRPESPEPMLYNLLLIGFYLAIALVVFLWVWPLSRDLRKLEKQTRLLGSDTVPPQLQLAPTSAVYDLASAFNRMAQRIRDLLAAHKEMTYAVSHELRTPLARMKFGLEMANDLNDLQKIKQQLAGVREDVTEMDALVNQLFAYAGFEQSDQKLDFQPGDMVALIQQLIARVKSSPNHRPLEYVFINQLGDETVVCEWYLMERAILNLLHNAQRYAATEIVVTLVKLTGQYRIQVDDDGPGIPEQERERIFQSFVRLADHHNAQARGLGLGLAIVQRIMRWHGGRAFADKSLQGGARLVLEWPATNRQHS